jgi:hypothetical protein
MTRKRTHTGIFSFEDNVPAENEDSIVVPENLQEIGDDELEELEGRAVEAFDELYDTSPTEPEAVNTLAELAEAVEALRGERTRREESRAEQQARADELRNRIHASNEDPEGGDDDAGDGGEAGDEAEAHRVEQPEPVAVAAAAAVPLPQPTAEPAVPKRTRRINVSMSEVRKHAPPPEVREHLSITAAADVPRYTAGHEFTSLDQLAHAFNERAKSTPISGSGLVIGPKVATIQNEYEHVISAESSPADVERIIKEITSQDALVSGIAAAGGWCAPSETTYDFFNITCEDGMVDLPEFGVSRGGIRFPTSPSMADVFTGTFTNATNPWLWTETDDILTVTGSTQKPCVRVPCPGFNDIRLECYGICLTAGNLTDNAYPEATRNQLALLRSAHFHAQNQRYIATMVALSSPVATGGFAQNGYSLAADLPSYAGWAAIDYRNRYGMCDNDILEVVLPSWAKEVMRADLAYRNGVEMLAVSDGEINNWFDVRSVRVQWVKDWQVRGTNQPGGATPTQLYPPTVQFMIYAAGTFGRGNGLTLDLGVVRDSVLNAENDHTAAWTEECHLIARFGHESRLYTVQVCASGRTGINDVNDCRVA